MGGPKDAQIAAIWYERAAELGHPEAQFNLALRYLHGDGVAEDAVTAASWLWRAMEQHHVEATCELGTLFRFGRGVNQSYKVAGCLHLQAAKGGDPVAHGNLCDYHQEVAALALAGDLQSALVMVEINAAGIGMDKDPVEALAWALTVGTPGLPFEEDDEAERKQHLELLSTLQSELSTEDQDGAKKRCQILLAQLVDRKTNPPVHEGELSLHGYPTDASRLLPALDVDLRTLGENAAYMRQEVENVTIPRYTEKALQYALTMIENVAEDASAIMRFLATSGSAPNFAAGDDPRLLMDQINAKLVLLRNTLHALVRSLEKAKDRNQNFALSWMLLAESSVNIFGAITSICAQLSTIEQTLASSYSTEGAP